MPSSRLTRLLSTFDTSAPVLTLFRIAPAVRLIGPPVEGVAALLVVAGTMRLEVEGEADRVVRAGQLALVPRGRVTRLLVDGAAPSATIEGRQCLVQRDGWLIAEATRGGEAAVTVAAGRIAGSAGEGLGETCVTALKRCPVARPMFGLLRAETVRGAEGQPSLASALLTACVIQGLRLAIETAPREEEDAVEAHGLIARAVTAMRDRPAEPHTLDTLAEAAGSSRSTFSRHFKRVTKMTPAAYLQQVRLEEARSLLEATTLPVKSVAAAAGFVSRSHFSRSFRAAYGCDPTRFREDRATLSSEAVPERVVRRASAGQK